MAESCLETEEEDNFKPEDEDTPAVEETTIAEKDEDNEEVFDLLEKLEADEARLSEQKERLSSLLEQLQQKVKKEIKSRKSRVRTLKSEITDLKTKCEKIAKFVNTGETPR